MFREYGLIESVNELFKHVCPMGQTRHYVVSESMVNIIEGLRAYNRFPNPTVWRPVHRIKERSLIELTHDMV